MSTTATPVTVTGTPVVTVQAMPSQQQAPPQRVYLQETIIVTMDDPDLKPAAGKVYIRSLAYVVGLFSVAELIASACVIHNSSGYYIGGVYVSIVSLLYAVFILSPTGLRTQADVGWRLILTWLNWIICLIGLAITAAQYNFVDSLEACATYSSTLSSSCLTTFPVQSTCNGNTDYYPDAAACEASYVLDNDGSITEDTCNCVTSSFESNDDDSGCYSFTNMQSCSSFLNNTSHQLATCLSFLVLLLVVFLVLLVVLSLSRYNPNAIKTRAEQAEEEESNNTTHNTSRQLNASLLNQQYVTSSSTPVVYVNSA